MFFLRVMFLWVGCGSMRRWQVAVAILVLMLVLIGFVVFIPILPKYSPQVGAFYYVWYDPAQ
jgi:hypothetical protein